MHRQKLRASCGEHSSSYYTCYKPSASCYYSPTKSQVSPRDPESRGDRSAALALAGLTRSRKRAFAPRSACETTAPAGYKVYFGTPRRGLGLQRSCPALPAATAVKIFLWNLWTTLETGQRTLKTDPGPKVIVSRMSHPFFPLGHSCFTRTA